MSVRSMQIRVNPVYLTAKTAVCLMEKAGIPGAAKIARALALEDKALLPKMTDAETILGNALVVEAKYRTMCRLIEASGIKTVVDLPCGYTPKAMYMTEHARNFVGLDLPIVVQEVEPIIRPLVSKAAEASFRGVDATNYPSLKAALHDVSGPLCIATEGMMMYFSEEEADTVIANIQTLLREYGGCWITPDPEYALQFCGTFQAVFGEESLAKLMATKETAQDQSAVASFGNSFLVEPAAIPATKARANALLAKHGLKAEMVNLGEQLPELSLYKQLASDQIRRFKEAMRNCHYWLITLDEKKGLEDTARHREEYPFGLQYTLNEKILHLSLCGRLDTISAPELLIMWEKVNIGGSIEGVRIDCTRLEYISSAGIRLLLKIQESCSSPIVFFRANEKVKEILQQKGLGKMDEN
ncbi:anti-anti-sigma factor [Selenomonas sp. WCT3]|uniref:STAS domain-containing protein n=1 Tax=Selenomonas sp. WCT3 TaxID=3158785 RepID=UPI000886913E|nr:anti-anti-sigma factor [Selenomonas ruminantium]